MTVFRWIIGVLSAGLVGISVIAFIMFMVQDEERWIELARKFRQLATVVLLFWFNVEIWGRVVYTLVTWSVTARSNSLKVPERRAHPGGAR